MYQIPDNVGLAIVRILIVLVVLIFGKLFYDFLKIIFNGFKRGWNKIYLILALIFLIITIILIPVIIGESYARVTVMAGFGLSLLFIYKSKKSKKI